MNTFNGKIKEVTLWVNVSWRDAVINGTGHYGEIGVGLSECLLAMEQWQRNNLSLLITEDGYLRKFGTPEKHLLQLVDANAKFRHVSIGKTLVAYIDEEAPKVLEALRKILENPEEWVTTGKPVWAILGWEAEAGTHPTIQAVQQKLNDVKSRKNG
jgi:hypothetical protein